MTYQPRLHTSMPPQETPAMKKRRLKEKQPPSLVASSATSSSPESTFSAESRLPIVQFKRPASRKCQGCTRPGAADTSEMPADAGDPEILDWRSELQKKVDYDTTVKLGKRLHYKDIAGNHSGKSGKERKKQIRADWSKLSAADKRAVYERAEAELQLTDADKLHLRRFLMFARKWESGVPVRPSVDCFLRAKQVLLTYHDAAWVLDRPAWDFKDSAEPLAAAAQACRGDPFVEKLTMEMETDITRITDVMEVDSWSVSLELCPETFALTGALRLHAHLALVFTYKTQIANAATLRLAGVSPTHAKAAGPLAQVRSRNFAPLHYYLQMPKRGGVWSLNNLAAFKKFAVNPRWITTWLQSEHLSLSKAREEYVKCKMNLLSTLPNLEVVERELLREAISAKKRIIEQALRAELCKFRPVPEKDVFLAQLLVIRSRYKLLVLVGISGTGKTVWAKWVFGDEENVLEVNCASCPEPDLR